MPTYTHVGLKDRVNYRNRGRLSGHDLPAAGKTHALNRVYVPHVGYVYRALCGEVVHCNEGRTEFGEPATPNVEPAPAGELAGVTCRRCRQRGK